MKPHASAHEIFMKAPFIQWMAPKVLELSDGVCRTMLAIRDEFKQQDGFIHAGILSTLADHCAGGAVGTLLEPNEGILSIEFKTNFLRAGKSESIYCKSICLKKGRTIAVCESSIYPDDKEDPATLISKTTVTLAVMKL